MVKLASETQVSCKSSAGVEQIVLLCRQHAMKLVCQLFFSMVVEIIDTQPGLKIHLLCM